MDGGAWRATVHGGRKESDMTEQLSTAQHTFLPGESQGQRSLAGYSPRGHKELNQTERLSWQTAVQKAHLSFNNKLVLLSALLVHCVCADFSPEFLKIYLRGLKTSNPCCKASTAFYWQTIASHRYFQILRRKT